VVEAVVLRAGGRLAVDSAGVGAGDGHHVAAAAARGPRARAGSRGPSRPPARPSQRLGRRTGSVLVVEEEEDRARCWMPSWR
jgi:hypothetical protein